MCGVCGYFAHRIRLKFKNTVLEFVNKDSESTRLDVVGVAFKIVLQEDVTSVCNFQARKRNW